MKEETRLAKLAELLGIKTEVEVHIEKKSNRNKVIEISEEEIQEFRAVQGVVYFLRAPELFKARLCSWRECGQPFAVSRQFVSVCSYTCLKDSLADLGIDWNRDGNTDAEKILLTIDGVWEGQEPLWIREPLLSRVRSVLNSLPDDASSQVTTSPSEKHGSLMITSSVGQPTA
jgi:hypothetical protein